MEYKVVKKTKFYHFKGEDGKNYGEPYLDAFDFDSYGIARVKKRRMVYGTILMINLKLLAMGLVKFLISVRMAWHWFLLGEYIKNGII